MSYIYAHKKYQNIKKRAFGTFIDLFLICTFIQDKSLSNANEENFLSFDYEDERMPKALKAYQLGKNTDEFEGTTVSELDKEIEKWYNTNDLHRFKLIFFKDKIISENDFKAFYNEDDFDRECMFCEIKKSEIELLIKSGLIQTKRLINRGKTMEVDQLVPYKGYVSGNIVTCCYWCNNAKSDEFTFGEFKEIGKEIRKIWEARLGRKLGEIMNH